MNDSSDADDTGNVGPDASTAGGFDRAPTADPSTWVLPPGPPTSAVDPRTWARPAAPPTAGPSAAPPPSMAPVPSAAPPPPPGPWSAPLLPAYAGPDSAPPPPPGTPKTKVRSRAALAVLSVTAVLAASTFAVVALTRPDGAGSADEAVEQLFDAISHEDALGVMESLPPSEREVLLDPMVETVGELQRLGVLESFALDDVPGADIEVDGLTLQSTPLGAGVTKVRVTGGTITGTVIPDEVPIGPRTQELAERNGGDPIDIQAETDRQALADADLELVAIEEDGGWHVSLFYSIAEAARGDAPVPSFGAGGIRPIGSDTPEGAVRGLVQAGLDLDLGRAIGHLPPDEMRVLYDYVPLVLDDANDAANDARNEGYAAQLDRLDLHSEGDGTTRQVTIDALDVTGSADDTHVHYAWDGDCTVMEITQPGFERFAPVGSDPGRYRDPEPAEPTTTRAETCTDGRITVTEDGEEVDDLTDELGPITPTPFGRDATFGQSVTVVEVEGRWYVSPVRSVADSLLAALRGIEGSDIDAFFESFDGWLSTSSSRFEPVGEAIPTPGTTPMPGTTPIPGPRATIPKPGTTPRPGPPGTVPRPGTPGTAPMPAGDDAYSICLDEVFGSIDSSGAESGDDLLEAFDRCLIEHGEEP